MKLSTVLFILFVLSSLDSFAQEQTIQLKLEEGHEYVFEKTDKIYGLKEDESKDFKQVRIKQFRLVIEKVNPEQAIEFSLHFLKNLEDDSPFNEVLNQTNYFFPNFNAAEIGFPASKFIESLSCSSTFKFSINLKTNEIELLNRVELLEQFYSKIKEQLTDSKLINEAITAINKNKYLIDDDLISFLIWFNNSKLESNQTITKTQLDDKFIVRERKGEFLNFGDQDFGKIIPGKTYKKYWLNLDNGLITNYSTIKLDSIKSSFERRYTKNVWAVQEAELKLLCSQEIQKKILYISGKIEKPLSDEVHIKILNEPFGVIMKTKTVLLDEVGTFTTKLDYSHAGFVYVENENKNRHNPPGTYVFYAEPGDTIHFESTGTELPWNTNVSGSKVAEQELIQELRKNIRILEREGRSGSYSNEIFDREIAPFANLSAGEMSMDFEMLFNSLKRAEKIVTDYRTKITERSFRFISNEVHSYFYRGIFYLARLLHSSDFGDGQYSLDYEVNWKSKVDEINVHEVYNDFGLHSRECIRYYLIYHFSESQKVRYRQITGPMSYHFSPEPEMDLQFARMMLTGSPLYRKIAADLASILENGSRYFSFRMEPDYLTDFALKNFELMKLRCNDSELIEKVNQLVSQHQKLQTGKFVPEIELWDINQNKVAIKDFLGEKPTIFYFSQNWINDRYEYDDMAVAMPEINFVMVVEGSNFKQWQEYTNRAAPEMSHLLFINDSVTFRDIFQAQSVHMVFDKTGQYIGNGRNAKHALSMAKQSLEPRKKEMDKSTLRILILGLMIALTTAILILLIWRWRARRKLKKEQQRTRLRELELTAIRSQMNPHFLFNSLNSVQNLVQQNKGREAHLYLSDFAGLIRKVLNNSEKEEVSLAEELEMIKQYLSLEKLRFDFEYTVSVDSELDVHNTMVPSMLLQPFVENAIIHGLQNKPNDRKLKIELAKEVSGLKIRIEDNGIGREAAKEISKAKNGKGSKLIQERLEILQEKNKEKYELKVIDLKDHSGTRVEILIPEER